MSGGFLLRRKAALVGAVLTMGLALGANTLAFSVVDAFLLSGFGVPEPERLLVIAPTRELPGRGAVVFADAWPNYELIREAQRSFVDVAATLQSVASWDDGREARPLQAARVTASFFSTAAVEPVLGRVFTAEEEGPSPAPVVVVGHDLWHGALGGAPDALGRTMLVNGTPHVVIGVMPEGFSLPLPTDVWLPFDIPETQWTAVTGARSLGLWGRLADGVTYEQAVAAMADLDRLALEATADNRDFRYTLQTVLQVLIPRADRTVLFVQVGAALLVLLAVLNLSTVLLSWTVERRAEMALRLALGASGGHVSRLLLVQGAIVVVAAGALGLALAWGAVPLLAALDVDPTLALFVSGLELDMRVLGVSLGAAAAAALLAGLPAVGASRGDLDATLRAGGRSVSLSAAAVRWQKGMVLTQAALTVVIVSAAALVGLSLGRLSAVPLGFEPGEGVVARVQLAPPAYAEHEDRVAFADRLMEALAAEGELAAAGFTSTLPVSDLRWGGRFHVEQPDGTLTDEPLLFHFRRVSWNYHDVIGIPIVRGRAFLASENGESPGVAIVSQALADRLWPGESAVGKPLHRVVAGGEPQRIEVVGVAGNTVDAGLTAPMGETVYVPWPQVSLARMSIVARGRGEPGETLEAVRRALRSADPTLAASDVAPLSALARQANALPRLQTVLLTAFALVAGGIVALGSYGVMSQLVAIREKELAVRMMLGATPGSLGASILVQAALVAGPGVVVGLVLFRLMGDALRPFVFGVDPGAPALPLAVGVGTLALVALVTLPPARRAVRQSLRRGLVAS